MKVEFELKSENSVCVAITPETSHEEMLLALWLRYDANSIAATVERSNYNVSKIRVLRLHASAAN